MTDTPRVFLAAYHDGLSPRYEIVPEGAMGAEPWIEEAWVMSDGQRLLRKCDVEGICDDPDLCFVEEESTVRCGPCAAKIAAAFGVELNPYTVGNPEAMWLRREMAKMVPEGAGVRVKALEWKDEGSDDWSAHCPVFGDLYVLSSKSRDDMSAKREARIRAALDLTTEPEPTSGAYDLICCTAEDVATGRGFTGDAVADLAMAQESLRACLKLLGWRG